MEIFKVYIIQPYYFLYNKCPRKIPKGKYNQIVMIFILSLEEVRIELTTKNHQKTYQIIMKNY